MKPDNWSRKAVAARMIAIENSVRVVDLALRAVGGSSYFKRLPLERLFRDVRAGIYHPFDSDETLELLGKTAFGLPWMVWPEPRLNGRRPPGLGRTRCSIQDAVAGAASAAVRLLTVLKIARFPAF